MLIKFKLDDYSSLAELNLFLHRILEFTIMSAGITKEGDAYNVEYSFDENRAPSGDQSEIYGFVKEFQNHFLTRRLGDADMHYSEESGPMISSISLKPSTSSTEDEILDVCSDLERLIDILLEENVDKIRTDLRRKVEGSRKYQDATVGDALKEVLLQLRKLKIT